MRLASIENWNLVVVADTKTPEDWNLENVHFLSVEFQKNLPFSLISSLPYKSYTRKNIGYLYAISQGAEWIYDTDDDNKPYDKLGLDQFEYEDTMSGVRYTVENAKDGIRNRLFNPYRYWGMEQMWPRGFPLEHFENHTNGKDNQILCQKMSRSAVQQGLVHHDPDVDAIYRLLNADKSTGLDVKFNKFAPKITLSIGTYSPWNSQNTLFHKFAFHTLFLPTTVSFRTTDIWRSFISQKILHLSGLTVSFVPTNAVQFRNAHDYLKDFKDEKQVFEDSGRFLEFLLNWNCLNGTILEDCMKKLGEDLVYEKLWGEEDSKLMGMFLDDLKIMGFEFPPLISENYQDPYEISKNESERNLNCRRMNLEFDLIDPKEFENQKTQKAEQKLNYFGNLADWCNETGCSDLSNQFPSPEQLADDHLVFENYSDTVLVVVNNYPWKYGPGIIQRLYQPYFAAVIFCGSWYPDQFKDQDNYTSIISPFTYIHINPAEILRGYFGYHCLTLVQEMGLNNVRGYFFMADDAIFNFWNPINFDFVHHLTGDSYENSTNWWQTEYGLESAKNILRSIQNTNDPKILETWKQFENGLKVNGFLKSNETVINEMLSSRGRSVSDFFYIPSSAISYYSRLMRIFYEHKLFLEIAVNTFLKSVHHEISLPHQYRYLWTTDRGQWDQIYSENLIAIHPVKMSGFRIPGDSRRKYCNSVLKTWSHVVFGGSQDFNETRVL
ncbi:unnamed protein product [Caenorhabditis nigoni]